MRFWRVGVRARQARARASGLLLQVDADTAARGVSERLLGLVGEVVEPNTVNEEQSGYGERAILSAGADKSEHTRGGGALEVGDLRLLEDGSERKGALDSDPVVAETVSEEQGAAGMVKDQECQRALTERRTLRLVRVGGGLLEHLQR